MAASPSASAGGSGDAVLDLLRSIDARLDQMERRLDAIESRTDPAQLDPFIATTTDIIDGWIAQARRRGIDVDDRAHSVLHLAERATREETVANLMTTLEYVDAGPEMVATVVDIVDSFIARQVERGVDPVELTKQLGRASERFANFVQSDAFAMLIDSAVLDPQTIRVIANVGEALSEEYEEGSKRIGAFGLLGALRDPDVQRAAGFGVGFAKRLGLALQKQLPAG